MTLNIAKSDERDKITDEPEEYGLPNLGQAGIMVLCPPKHSEGGSLVRKLVRC